MIKKIYTKQAPTPIGPYSQAIQAGDFIYISGQIGLNANNELPPSIEEQTHQVMKNIGVILKECGGNYNCLVKTTIYLKNISDFPIVNQIYQSYLNEPYPARCTIEVSCLPKDALVEIEAIAFLNTHRKK